MAPQPLSELISGRFNYFKGHHALRVKPELAATAFEAIALRSSIDATVALALVRLLGPESRTAIAMFSSATSTQAQMSAIEAAAKLQLPADDLPIFLAAIKVIRKSSDERNKFAHWVWAYSPQVPDALLLIDPKEHVKNAVRLEDPSQGQWDMEIYEPHLNGVWAYKHPDLLKFVSDLEAIHKVAWDLILLAHKDGVAYQGRHLLLGSPLIQSQLAREKRGRPITPKQQA